MPFKENHHVPLRCSGTIIIIIIMIKRLPKPKKAVGV